MTLYRRFRAWLRAIRHRSRLESEIDAELRYHLDSYANDLISRGISREAALRRARLEFGSLERAKEECREARHVTFHEYLLKISGTPSARCASLPPSPSSACSLWPWASVSPPPFSASSTTASSIPSLIATNHVSQSSASLTPATTRNDFARSTI